MNLKDCKYNPVGGDNTAIVLVALEGGCRIEDGEYSISVIALNGYFELNDDCKSSDFDLIRECVEEQINHFGLKQEQFAKVFLRESGEREDVFWNKYYVIESWSLHDFDGRA